MQPANFHATGLVLGTAGLLIAGPSGSGKTSLALALIDAWKESGRFARLIADDQLLLSAHHGRLVASAPVATAGLVEIFGLGPRRTAFLQAAVIDCLCRLVPPGDAPRFQEDGLENLHGCSLPTLALPVRDSAASARALTAWLAGPTPS